MSARTLAILTAVLVAAPAAYADFSADLVLSTTTPTVNPGDSVVVTVSLADLTLTDTNPGDDLSRISLNLSKSDLDFTVGDLNAGWVWDEYIYNNPNHPVNPGLGLGVTTWDATVADDNFVIVSNAGPGNRPDVTEFVLGWLSFEAPSPAVPTTYNLNLTGGTTDDDTTRVGDGDVYAGLTLGTLDITVLPEPATLALLGMGGAALLLRRRRR